MVGVAATAGIGFTVALFITALAYTAPAYADDAKVGIFAGSIVAGLLGMTIFFWRGGSTQPTSPREDGATGEPARTTL
jgi:Na+/H+ antiporter NhaA